MVGQDDVKARAILDEAAGKIKKASGVEASFQLTIEHKEENIQDEYEGRLLLKGEKFRINILGVETYCDGVTQWMHLVEEQEVNVMDAEEEEGDFSAKNIFHLYENGFTLNYKGERILNGERFYEIDMFPEDKEESYFKVTVCVDKKTNNFRSFTAHGKEGVDHVITIRDLDVTKDWEDAVFVFDKAKFPNVEIIDLR